VVDAGTAVDYFDHDLVQRAMRPEYGSGRPPPGDEPVDSGRSGCYTITKSASRRTLVIALSFAQARQSWHEHERVQIVNLLRPRGLRHKTKPSE
jgi:hypothetical protein